MSDLKENSLIRGKGLFLFFFLTAFFFKLKYLETDTCHYSHSHSCNGNKALRHICSLQGGNNLFLQQLPIGISFSLMQRW